MQLYFAPLACSMATRIALYETGADAQYIQRDRNKRLPDGSDFTAINPLGMVPTLRTGAGKLITENAAILQYVADRAPQAGLVPASGIARARLHQWLSFIGTELHKAVYLPLLSKVAPAEVKAYALSLADARFAIVEKHLTEREFLLDAFSVADAFLFTVLNWTGATPLKLDAYPAIQAYVARLAKRPSIAKALGEELEMYKAEVARAKAA
ncbi:MAG: glutathione binding-like protein [Alphaproteobacteria bacterium]